MIYSFYRPIAVFFMAMMLSSCALFGFENQCSVVYEQNLELTKPPVVPTSGTQTVTKP